MAVGIDVIGRRGAAAPLRESEERFRLLCEAPPLPYQSLDSDGVLIAVNEAWRGPFGYCRADVLGHAFADLLATADVEPFWTAFERCQSRGHAETQFEMVRADGETVAVALDGRVGHDAAGKRTHCILADVTEQRRAVAALQRSDDRYRALSRMASSWVSTRAPDGSLLAPFGSFLEFTGMTVAEVGGANWLSAVHPDDRDGVTSTWAAAVARLGVFKMEFRLRRAGGAYEWFSMQHSPILDAEGCLIEYVGTSVNVHERNVALEALRESEQRHRALFEQALVAMFVFDRDLRGFAARYLDIEITETAVMADADLARATVHQLKELGVRLAIDDFGTGYSSLSMLSSLPVGAVKIDRSFIAGLLDSDRDMTIVTAVIALGHRLGLSVVAEGVETREQCDALRLNGCDEMQGFLFSRPLAAPACEELLRRHRLLA